MATKYFVQSLALLSECGMAENEARTVARLASAFRKDMGMEDVGLYDGKGGLATKAKVTSKSVTVSVKDSHKLTLAKGHAAPKGAHAMRFIECVAELASFGQCVSVTLPDFAAGSHLEFERAAKAAEAVKAEEIEAATENE